ncbi:cytochrome P450 [Pseudonocardia eucalypti]|uniref:Cytochrome P450 n=2 Tax=Pseudonocardia eucalypti TaxID=648755 RepID=A0ABP9QD94_9PSEU
MGIGAGRAAGSEWVTMTAEPTTGCPIAADFDPLAPAFVADPHPELSRLRERSPVWYSPKLDRWVVTGYREIEHILADPATFSAVEAQRPLHPPCPEAAEILAGLPLVPTMSNCDPPAHRRYRTAMTSAMSPRRVAGMRPVITRRATELIDRFAADGRADLVPALFFPLPALTVFALIGLPLADADRIKAWCADKLEVNWGRPTRDKQIRSALGMREFFDYVAAFVAGRRREPGDDLVDQLIADERSLTDPEITSLVFALSFAGHETTTNLLGNLTLHLLRRPGLWLEITEDRSLIAGAVEEALRFESSVPMWRRVTTTETEVGGVRLAAGSRLVLAFAAADREPGVFPEPDRFDIRRANARRQLSFGRGIHLCLGAGLARLECEIVVNLMADRLPGLRLAPGASPRFTPNLSFRGPLELPARWAGS